MKWTGCREATIRGMKGCAMEIEVTATSSPISLKKHRAYAMVARRYPAKAKDIRVIGSSVTNERGGFLRDYRFEVFVPFSNQEERESAGRAFSGP